MASADTGHASQTNKDVNLDGNKAGFPLGLGGKHDAQATSIQVDFIILFSLLPPKGFAGPKASHANNLQNEYDSLMKTLRDAGLDAVGRPGAKGRNEIMILVRAGEERVREEVERERLSDWLHGISSTAPDPKNVSSSTQLPYTPAQRLRHVYNILTLPTPSPSSSPTTASTTLSGAGAAIQIGTSPFQHVTAIFPPHDPQFNRSWLRRWSDRKHFWGIPESELDEIRAQFGEGIAYYFAFLRAYTKALLFPAGFGTFCWAFGMEYSPIYAVALCLWSVVFVEFWSVREKLYAVKWNASKCGKVERWRTEFAPEAIGTDEVTGERVGKFPWWKREVRTLGTIPILGLFVVGLVCLITGITAVELLVNEVYNGPGKKYLSLLPTILFAGLVPQLVSLWQTVALRLVGWENHSHESSHDRSLTLKMFALNAIVAYTGLLLTAFVYIPFGSLIVPHLANFAHAAVKRDAVPGVEAKDLDGSSFNSSTYAINSERLHTQLFAYTVTNQVVNTFLELGLPGLLRFVGKKVAEVKDKRAGESGSGPGTPREDEGDEKVFLERLRGETILPQYNIFVDYAEMVIQFGYVVLWTAVWPIAPVFALVNNFFELRTDALKLSTQSRRPVPIRTDTIGPWLDALGLVTWVGAMINAALVYLFRPCPNDPGSTSSFITSAAHGEPMMAANATATEKVIAKAMSNIGRAAEDVSPYYALRGALFSALLVALASEHGYFIARSVIRRGLERFVWVGSPAFTQQRKAEWELKRSFLGTINMGVDGSKLRRDTLESQFGPQLGSEKGEEGTEEDKRFWGRGDLGREEIGRVTKVD